MASPRASAQAPMTDTDEQKRAAAEAAALLIKDGDRVGLGTGSTVAHLLPVLQARGLSLHCAATSPATEHAARKLGLLVQEPDQIDPNGWLVKGGGPAHTHEKIVAAASKRFVVIASAEKAVAELRPPVPLEILRFGAQATLTLIGEAMLRDVPPSPEDNLIADYFGPIEDARALAARLAGTPGVVDHGLFAARMVSDILIAGPDGVEHRELEKGTHT